jgi:hypothetical protein
MIVDLWQTFRTLALVDGFANPDPLHDLRPALDYYGPFFKFERSYTPAFDMTIDKVIDLSDTGKRKGVQRATLSGVLDAMIGANAGLGRKTFQTYLLVSHGHPDGFVMKIDPQSNIQANSPYVDRLTEAANAVRRRDIILKFIGPKDQLKALQDLIKTLRNRPSTSEIDALTTVADAQKTIDDWIGQLTSIQQTEGNNTITATIPLDRLVALINKRNQFADGTPFRRLEIRACNIGRSSFALKVYAEFFGVMEITAPLVFTSYKMMKPTKFTPKQFAKWTTARAPFLTATSTDVEPDDRTRALVARGPTGKTPKSSPTLKYGIKLQDVGGTSTIDLHVTDDAATQEFIQRVIKPDATFKSGAFPLMLFDAAHENAILPDEAKGKPFIFPTDPEYRAMIKSFLNIGPIPVTPVIPIGPF